MLKEILKDAQGVPTGNYKDIAGGTLYADSPIGSIVPYGGATAPSGWLICNGASLLRTDYAELFAVIGTAFGSADSTHFNIPDMRESVPKGAGETGQTVGAHVKSGGLAVGEFLDDRVQSHEHQITGATGSSGVGGRLIRTTSESSQIGMDTWGQSDRRGNTTEVKSVGVNYIIKAKMVALPADFMSAVDEAVEEAIGEWETVPITQVVTSGRSWVEVKCAKKGDLVTLSGIITLSAYSEANVIATGFPKPKAPSLTTNGTYIIVPSFVGSDSSGVNVRVDKNGNLIMYNANSEGNVYFGTTYALI